MNHERAELTGPELPGRTILVLLLVLVALLEFMVGGAKLLLGALRGDVHEWAVSSAFAIGIGACYLVLAWGVWRLRAWIPLFTVLLTLLVLAFGILRFTQDSVLDLALALVFMLAMITNLGVLGWVHLSSTQAQLDAATDEQSLQD